MRVIEIVKQIAWTVPITVAFTDLVASVVKVEGPSMQPTFNPQLNKTSDWVLVEKVGTSSTTGSSHFPHDSSHAIFLFTLQSLRAILPMQFTSKVLYKYNRGDVVILMYVVVVLQARDPGRKPLLS